MTTETELTQEELERYARHLSLPSFGIEAQHRLKESSVLCIGAGGLGSPSTMYLAAAGVGRIGIVDPDTVDTSNLQRQLLHGTLDVGRKKIQSAKETLNTINPNVHIELHEDRFEPGNAMALSSNYDLLIDGSDNFPTRYLSNDVSVLLGIPNVHGSIFRFEGQVSVFAPHLGAPCYRCLFPDAPDQGAVPDWIEGGVLGVLPGIIGTLQATEAIKLLSGIGDPLTGRLLHYDALSAKFRSFNLRQDPECAVCGKNPTITGVSEVDYRLGFTEDTAASISVVELSDKLQTKESMTLLDVREPEEVAECSIEGATFIPLAQLKERLGELPRQTPIFVHCKSGQRSARAVTLLRNEGYPDAMNVQGGMDAWLQLTQRDTAGKWIPPSAGAYVYLHVQEAIFSNIDLAHRGQFASFHAWTRKK